MVILVRDVSVTVWQCDMWQCHLVIASVDTVRDDEYTWADPAKNSEDFDQDVLLYEGNCQQEVKVGSLLEGSESL